MTEGRPAVPTDKQQMVRWRAKYDFLELWITTILMEKDNLSKEDARTIIQNKCEEALRPFFAWPPVDAKEP